MPSLFWLIPFCILTVIFVVFGYRDLVGSLRIGPKGSKGYKVWILAVLWLAGLGGIYYFWWSDSPKFISDPVFWGGILVFSALMFVLMSLSNPLRRRGPGRIYALAWTTFREAMSQRAWLAVPVWLVGVLIVGVFVSPYRLIQDRMMLSTELLIRGQLLVTGLLILTLACRSIPQELDRQTITVTASKPINRLELVIGKLLGFVLLSGLLIGAMGLLSYAILWHHGQTVRRQAQRELAVQEDDYQALRRTIKPDADLKDIAQHGVLHARDALYPIGHVGFNGKFDPYFDQRSCLKGASEAAIEWRFDEIPVSGRLPVLMLNFGIERVPEEITNKEDFDPVAPLKIKVLGIGSPAARNFRAEQELEMAVPPGLGQVGLSRDVRFPTGTVFGLDSAKWGPLYNSGPVVIRLTFPVQGHYLYFGRDSIRLENLSPDRPGAKGQTRMVPPEHGQGVVVGRKFKNSYEVAGVQAGQPEVAYWHFHNVNLGKFGPGDDIDFEIQSYREISDVVKSHTIGLVRAMVIKPDGSRTSWPTSGPDEAPQGQKLLSRNWPGWQQIVIREKRPSSVKLPRTLFSKNSDVYVFLACGSEQGWIGLAEKSGYLSRGKRLFAENVLRCEAIIFMQVATIAAVAVMASSFLSWPVACFLSMSIYLVGSVSPYLEKLTQFWGQLGDTLAGYGMKSLSTVLPNFAAYRASEYIAQGEVIASDKLAALLIHTGICIVALLMLAYLCLRSRELAK